MKKAACTNLLRRDDTLLLGFNSQLRLQFGYFFLSLVDSLHNGINALALLKSLPEVFNGGVHFLNIPAGTVPAVECMIGSTVHSLLPRTGDANHMLPVILIIGPVASR